MALSTIARICLISADPDALASFYCRAFGFEQVGADDRCGPDIARLAGVEPACARALLLRLGGQTLELLGFTARGSPYPPGIDGTDRRFQHFAVVVADMAAAYARLQQCAGWERITPTVPQQLPARSGGVWAFKFRDPEGHPLELLAFPPQSEPPYWRQARGGSLCLGIDHSAITVASTARSVEFYQQVLGWSVGGRSLNCGEEQALLDNVPQPIVEVTALDSLPSAPPHLELLCYRGAAPSASPLPRPNDIAATQLVLEVNERDLERVLRQLARRADVSFISTEPRAAPQYGNWALIREPDGHILRLISSVRTAAPG